MEEKHKIPLTVGVTGHIDLREQDRDTLYRAVKDELNSLREKYPHTPVRMLNSLAAGADQLCADAAEDLGIPVTAVLPMEADEYALDFDESGAAALRRRLERADRVFAAPAAEPAPPEENRDFRYRQAGIFIAEHSHALIALWDGREDTSGCGTAAAVRITLEGDWQPEAEMPVRSAENSLVIQIRTPRAKDNDGSAGEVVKLGNVQAWESMMDRTEEFNRLAEQADPAGDPLLPEDAARDPAMEQMEGLYHTADALSISFARMYRKALARLALAGTALTMTFLMYDDAELKPMILASGAALLLAVWLFRRTNRTACHRRFIEYRMLAEAFRVQVFLRYAGSRIEAQRLMAWTEQVETPWILCAVCGANAAPPPEKQENILERWVNGQRDYHREAGRKTAAKEKRKDRILGIAMRISMLVYLAALVYELLFGGLLLKPVAVLQNPETVRTILKIVLGTVSAGTLFMAGFYGKMSLGRVTADHEKMVGLYEKAADRIARRGQDEQILETLAREELTENGNWSSYQRDNAPELNV